MSKRARTPALHGLYQQYLVEQDADRFARRVTRRYTVGTLERLTVTGDRMVRRAAVLAIGNLADYPSNATLGRALHDDDRGVRMLAENGIRQLWCRVGTAAQRRELEIVIELNASQQFEEAAARASKIIEQAPWMAESWNQRALARFNLRQFADSIQDCTQTLEINPYHFGAATGMGQCQLKLKDHRKALECFRRALRLNPNLEGVRAHVLYLQRTLKSQE